ncbi:MAG TPA: immune inhibitor A [Anaerolineales bacterium]|nr:immune inhibitor A [Anaerolineales bacterium]HMS00328.1 immune inhibitor A [Anaerolineales bacterium]HNQ94297.1 immune inhibitor A [Anaerolineales bacterium]HNS60828.1 immune inhibitor A [Anaerolineales bacterium]
MDSNNSSSSNNTTKIVGGIVAVLLCCACVVIAAAGYFFYQGLQQIPDLPTAFPPIDVPGVPTSTPQIDRPTPDSISTETLETLGNTLVPENNPYELACRLQNICNVPATVPSKSYKLGDQETFWVTNVDTVENFQAKATLRYVGDHIYFWIENGVSYDEGDLKRLAETFENQMYPTNREFFGSEPNPGIDEDPRIFILYVRGTGASNAGYFSTPDEYNPLVKEFSNGHEMFFFNADNMDLGAEDTYGTLAHEFQHMIHFNTDRNEASWINEGFAMVAELLNDYPIYFDYYYITDPDLNLTDWSPDPGSNGPHYGQSFLYLAYFLDRFGEDATKEMVKHPENGLASIDQTLADLNITDPQTGKAITADDVFMDWAATMWLQDESVGDGRYHYGNYPDAPNISVSQSMDSCPQSTSGSVNQYGIDYFTITCPGSYTLNFSGSTVAKLLPADAHSGKYAFWSNKGDESNMTLTREFDFTSVSAPITLSYSMWYDLETDYDYLFLEASTDGKTWQILTSPSCTNEDPSGNSYGCGYNGQTGDWQQEDVDLSQFAGEKVQIRFEYITDAAVNGEGFLLDDVRVDAAGYTSDFEADDGGWIAAGFARVENVLPQTYRLSIIIKGDTTTVTQIPVNPDQTAEFPLSLKPGEEAILIVTGTTRYTRLPAAYQVEIK